jgi:hypothetical protein
MLVTWVITCGDRMTMRVVNETMTDEHGKRLTRSVRISKLPCNFIKSVQTTISSEKRYAIHRYLAEKKEFTDNVNRLILQN